MSIVRSAVVAGLIVVASARVCAACLQYEPAEVAIRGKMISRVFPGPPNYESIAAGDRAETALLLQLEEPVCVDGKPADLINSASELDVVLIHIIPHDGLSEEPSRWIGQRVSIVGRLLHSHTGHHRSRILIWPTSIRPG